MTPIITTGFISDEARKLLIAHQVPVIPFQDLELILLDRTIGGLNNTARPLEYVVGFWAGENDVEEDTLIVHLAPDANETKVIARPGYWSAYMSEERPVV